MNSIPWILGESVPGPNSTLGHPGGFPVFGYGAPRTGTGFPRSPIEPVGVIRSYYETYWDFSPCWYHVIWVDSLGITYPEPKLGVPYPRTQIPGRAKNPRTTVETWD